MSDFSDPKLIHGVFNGTEDVLKNTLERLVKEGFTVDQFTWIGPETPPDFTEDAEVVVALDVTLDTFQHTFEFAWKWVAEGEKNDTWDPDKLRLLQGSEAFKPMTFRWRRIKLNANVGKRPIDVRSVQTSPGNVLVFVAAQHPARVNATDYRARFGWFIPGLECTVPGGEPWRYVPFVYFVYDAREVGLHAHLCVNGYSEFGVPVFWE